jgi:hypothetical protein
MKVFARARAPVDAASSLFSEFLITELAPMVKEVTERVAG